MTQRAGASPHPPLDLLLALVTMQKTPHAGASPRPPQYSMSRIRSLSRHQDDEWCCPVFQDPIKQSSRARRMTASRCATHATASAVILASQVVACAIFRRCTTPELPSKAEQPAAVRCKPSYPTMMVPQAPPSDAVPRRTDNCQAMSTTAVRCKQPDPTSM